MSAVNRLREAGVITSFHYGKEDHGILTCSVRIDFDGSVQSFGNLCLDHATTGPDFLRNLQAIFHNPPPDLIGEKVFALRCFDSWNVDIEGLESTATGRRFTITEWRRKFDSKTPDPLDAKLTATRERIEWMKRDVARLREGLLALPGTYHPIDEARRPKKRAVSK